MSNLKQNAVASSETEASNKKSELPSRSFSSNYFCNSPSYSFKVVRDPKVRSGIPVIKGTRIGVYEIADLAKVEEIDAILENYDTLNRDMIEKAVQYAAEHPQI